MKKTTKTLDAFSFDVNFFADEIVIALTTRYGSQAVAVLLNLLCIIHRNGYFARWNDLTRGKVAFQIPDVDPETIDAIVRFLVDCGCFDQGLYASHAVLTSADIQLGYLAATRSADPSQLPFLLVDVPEKKQKKSLKAATTDQESSAITTPEPTQADAPPCPDAPCGPSAMQSLPTNDEVADEQAIPIGPEAEPAPSPEDPAPQDPARAKTPPPSRERKACSQPRDQRPNAQLPRVPFPRKTFSKQSKKNQKRLRHALHSARSRC